MEKNKNNLLQARTGMFLLIFGLCTFVLCSFRMGSVPPMGEVTLNYSPDGSNPVPVKFTRWRFTEHNWDDTFTDLHFKMIVFPTYFETLASHVDQDAIRDILGGKLVLEVSGVKKVGRQQFIGDVTINRNATIHQSKIYIKPMSEGDFALSGTFDIGLTHQPEGKSSAMQQFTIHAFPR